nr:unnamed protein product [Haemonchus contortus]
MERLVFAFVLFGTTLACSPVPEPKVKGKGNDTVYVTLVTNHTYNPAGVSTFLSDFSQTEIQQYSASVGNFSDLNCTNTDGYFTWTFKLTDANCSIVRAWVKQIVASSSFYKAGYTSCGSETETAYVTLITGFPINGADSGTQLKYFPELLDFPENVHPPYVGNYTDLHVTNIDGCLAYTLAFTNANCSIVKEWYDDVITTTAYFNNGTFSCVHTGAPTSGNENLIEIKATPLPTTTTATPLVMLPGGAPSAPVVISYQSDYEETAEHVEGLSLLESMSIMNL